MAERHDIDGMRPPPAWEICASLAPDKTPDEPCTDAYSHLNNTFMTQNKQIIITVMHTIQSLIANCIFFFVFQFVFFCRNLFFFT